MNIHKTDLLLSPVLSLSVSGKQPWHFMLLTFSVSEEIVQLGIMPKLNQEFVAELFGSRRPFL